MKWKRNTGFDQIEDRRGQGGGAIGFPGGGGTSIPIPIPGGKAGGGLGGIIVLVVLFLLFSGVLGGSGSIPGLGGLSGGGNAQPGGTLNPQSDTDQQLAYIVDSIQTFWASTFQESGKQYPETKLVLFEGSTDSSCGPASAATGPFYCPADQKVYLDLGFFDELQSLRGERRRLRDGLRRGPRVRPPHPDGPRHLRAGAVDGRAGSLAPERPLGPPGAAGRLSGGCLGELCRDGRAAG
jgi:predicted metalloprotease